MYATGDTFADLTREVARDYQRELRYREADRWLHEYIQDCRRHMKQQGHRPPPVPIELASLEAPASTPRSVVRRRPWLMHARGGVRERRPRRRVLRTWEREALSDG